MTSSDGILSIVHQPILYGVLCFALGGSAWAAAPEDQGSALVTMDSECYTRLYSGTIGRHPVSFTLRSRGGKGEAHRVDGFYHYDKNGKYRVAENRVEYKPLNLNGRVDPDGTLELEERAPGKQVASGRFTGTEDAEGLLTGTWTSPDGKKSLPFRLKLVPGLEEGRKPKYRVNRADGTLEIGKEKPMPLLDGIDGSEAFNCPDQRTEFSVRLLSGRTRLYAIVRQDLYQKWGIGYAGHFWFARPGELEKPLYEKWVTEAHATDPGFQCMGASSRLDYSYSGSTLQVITRLGENIGSVGCPCCCVESRVSATVERVDAKTGERSCDKVALARSPMPICKAGNEQPVVPDPVQAGDGAVYLDDGLSAWLLIPEQNEREGTLVFSQVGKGQGPWIGPSPHKGAMSALSDPAVVAGFKPNGGAAKVKGACWLFNLTTKPDEYQKRAYPPAPDALIDPERRFMPLAGGGLQSRGICSWDVIDPGHDGTFKNRYGLEVKPGADGISMVIAQAETPLAFYDAGQGVCYSHQLAQEGRWGKPWDQARYEALFQPKPPAPSAPKP